MIPISHTVQVTSFGGSATTSLIHWLASNNFVVGADPIWKHQSCPPDKDKYIIPAQYKPLYLIGDPVDSVISIFRRNIHNDHAKNMNSEFSMKGWNLKKYIDQNTDCFNIHNQLISWTTSKRDYNILCLKYKSIWDNIDILFDFFQIDSSLKESFLPKKQRLSTNSNNYYRSKLQDIYHHTISYIDSLQDCFII